MRTVADFSFEGKTALIRVDFNVPLNEKLKVTDDTRIRASLPTIKKILAQDGNVILMSHLGRPKSGPANEYSLKPVVQVLSKLLRQKVKFADDCVGKLARQMAKDLAGGEVLLLENLRFHKEETEGNKPFAKKLAMLADVYVNDAFGTAHRAHASTCTVADYFPPESRMFGLLMAKEVENATNILERADSPFTAIIGGAKVSDKIPILNKLIEKADHVLIGGGMAYTFIKAGGGSVGKSLLEKDFVQTAADLIAKAEMANVKLILPVDCVAAQAIDRKSKTRLFPADNIPDDWMGLDIGKKTCDLFKSYIRQSKTILWNGPMGVFELKPFAEGTRQIARAVARATSGGVFSMVGGGDSVAAINQMKLSGKISFVSTGGGAMLEFLEGKTLPGIKAILG